MPPTPGAAIHGAPDPFLRFRAPPFREANPVLPEEMDLASADESLAMSMFLTPGSH